MRKRPLRRGKCPLHTTPTAPVRLWLCVCWFRLSVYSESTPTSELNSFRSLHHSTYTCYWFSSCKSNTDIKSSCESHANPVHSQPVNRIEVIYQKLSWIIVINYQPGQLFCLCVYMYVMWLLHGALCQATSKTRTSPMINTPSEIQQLIAFRSKFLGLIYFHE